MPFRSYPKHLGRSDGRGYVQCDRTGRLRKPHEVMDDQGARVAKESADYTPGFGTDHPQDRRQADEGGDPTPIEYARPQQPARTKRDLEISDEEILAAIAGDRPPRPGY